MTIRKHRKSCRKRSKFDEIKEAIIRLKNNNYELSGETEVLWYKHCENGERDWGSQAREIGLLRDCRGAEAKIVGKMTSWGERIWNMIRQLKYTECTNFSLSIYIYGIIKCKNSLRISIYIFIYIFGTQYCCWTTRMI